MKLEILISMVVGIVLVLFMFYSITISKKKMRKITIKISEAANNIDIYLKKKKDLLMDTKKYITKEDYLDGIKDLNFDDVNSFEAYNMLNDYNNQFQDELFENEDIKKDENIINLINNLKDNNSCLNGSIRFYNDSVNKYKILSKKFPTNLVKLFCGFKKYNIYDIKKASSMNLY